MAPGFYPLPSRGLLEQIRAYYHRIAAEGCLLRQRATIIAPLFHVGRDQIRVETEALIFARLLSLETMRVSTALSSGGKPSGSLICCGP